MKIKFIKTVFYCSNIVFIFLFLFYLFTAKAKGSELNNNNLISTVLVLAEEYNYVLDREQLVDDVNAFISSESSNYKTILYTHVIKAVRQQGLFLNAFILDVKDLKNIKDQGDVFIALMKEEDTCLIVKNVENTASGFKFHCMSADKEEIIISEKDFMLRWEGKILSKPFVGIMAKKAPYAKGNNKFVVVYSYHSGGDFDSFKKVLDELKKEANEEGKELIYIDELGLIPEEAIKSHMEINKMDEKQVFENFKSVLKRDVSNLEKGIKIYGESDPFYSKLYSYLAQNKVKSFMEDLQYETWRDIVAFDSIRYYDNAVNYFFFNNINKYLVSIGSFIEGYWEYNVNRRDEDFRQQVRDIITEYPNSLIFTIRGIGHYGMEEKLNEENLIVETLVLGNGSFEENLLDSQIYYIFLSNGVVMKKDSRRLFFLKAYIEDTLRAYFIRKGLDISEATRTVCKISKQLQEKDVLKFSRAIYYAVIKQPETLQKMWEFTYNWMRNEGFIAEEELRIIQN